MVWASLTNLVTNAIFFVVLLRMIAEGVPAVQIGLVSMAAGLGGILGAMLAPSLIHRMPTGRLTVLIGWMCCLPLVPLTVSSSVWTACASTFFLLLLNPVGNAGISSYRMAVTPAHLQGRVGSTSQFASMSVMPLAPLLGGYLLEHQGGATAITALVVAPPCWPSCSPRAGRSGRCRVPRSGPPRPRRRSRSRPRSRLAGAGEPRADLGDPLGQLRRRLHDEVRAGRGQHHHRPVEGVDVHLEHAPVAVRGHGPPASHLASSTSAATATRTRTA